MTHTNEAVVEAPRPGRPAGMWSGLVLAAIVIAAVGALIAQNTSEVSVHWLTLDRRLPLWAMLALTAVAGALLARLLGFAWRHRRHQA